MQCMSYIEMSNYSGIFLISRKLQLGLMGVRIIPTVRVTLLSGVSSSRGDIT